MMQSQAKFIAPVPQVDDTLLRRIIFFRRESGVGPGCVSVSDTTACPRRRQLSPKAGIAAPACGRDRAVRGFPSWAMSASMWALTGTTVPFWRCCNAR
jgi:hypothetical protein